MQRRSCAAHKRAGDAKNRDMARARVGSSIILVLASSGCSGRTVSGDGDGSTTEATDSAASESADATGSATDSRGPNGATTSDAGSETQDAGGTTLPPNADSGSSGDPCEPGGDCTCEVVQPEPCDRAGAAASIGQALDLECGEPALSVELTRVGSEAAFGVRTGFGEGSIWAPRRGEAFAVVGSGNVVELDNPTPDGAVEDQNPTYCNDDLSDEFDPGPSLPTPLVAEDVAGDCVEDSSLVGSGDCSSTIAGQFSQAAMGAFDYAEIRVGADIEGQTSLGFDFAFFSTEYPFYYGQAFNDMFVAWLESERWTGNVSFDGQGNPVSLNAAFLDYRDDNGTLVPEFAGTCMRRHAGTSWVSTVAPVSPGESATLVLAIFDLQDSILDSYVFVDGLSFGCEDVSEPTSGRG